MRSRHVTGLALAALIPAVAACGETESHVNKDRPAAAINVTAAIIDGHIAVSPKLFGAGPIRLVITNQSDREQAVTFRTAGREAGITRSTSPIRPDGTATLEVDDVDQGLYEVRTSDDAIEPARVVAGAPRPSAQDQLLQP